MDVEAISLGGTSKICGFQVPTLHFHTVAVGSRLGLLLQEREQHRCFRWHRIVPAEVAFGCSQKNEKVRAGCSKQREPMCDGPEE